MKRNRDDEEEEKEEEKIKKKMKIVWQTPAHLAQKDDYILHNGKRHVRPYYFEFVSHGSGSVEDRVEKLKPASFASKVLALDEKKSKRVVLGRNFLITAKRAVRAEPDVIPVLLEMVSVSCSASLVNISLHLSLPEAWLLKGKPTTEVGESIWLNEELESLEMMVIADIDDDGVLEMIVVVSYFFDHDMDCTMGTNLGSSCKESGSLDALRTILREEGWIALYKGLGPGLLMVSHGAIQFTAYEELCRIRVDCKERKWKAESASNLLVLELFEQGILLFGY
ncbi:hypothetical protein REPUB_Repub08aG0030800 [Reevesia pubescens]